MRTSHLALLGAVFIAACSERPSATAPGATASLTTTDVIGDRPYTWSFKCEGQKIDVGAVWYWMENGVEILGSRRWADCSSNSGTSWRPANANGFYAAVGYSSEQTWTFDPALGFSAKLNGTVTMVFCSPYTGKCQKASGRGTLTVDS